MLGVVLPILSEFLNSNAMLFHSHGSGNMEELPRKEKSLLIKYVPYIHIFVYIFYVHLKEIIVFLDIFVQPSCVLVPHCQNLGVNILTALYGLVHDNHLQWNPNNPMPFEQLIAFEITMVVKS